MLNQNLAKEKLVEGANLRHEKGDYLSQPELRQLARRDRRCCARKKSSSTSLSILRVPLSRATLESMLAILEGPPSELVRKDRRFEELGLRAANYVSAEAVVALLLKHPELMQRPVIVRGGKAVIARPPERLLPLIEAAG